MHDGRGARHDAQRGDALGLRELRIEDEAVVVVGPAAALRGVREVGDDRAVGGTDDVGERPFHGRRPASRRTPLGASARNPARQRVDVGLRERARVLERGARLGVRQPGGHASIAGLLDDARCILLHLGERGERHGSDSAARVTLRARGFEDLRDAVRVRRRRGFRDAPPDGQRRPLRVLRVDRGPTLAGAPTRL